MPASSSSISHLLLERDILLESGTNELEMLVFHIGEGLFGVNVAKIREVIQFKKITRLPRIHPAIYGVINLRNEVIPCVSLASYLELEQARSIQDSTLLVAHFNNQQAAFIADSIDRIYRLSWKQILTIPSDDEFSGTPVTSVANCEGREVIMLDFEKILGDITNLEFVCQTVNSDSVLDRSTAHVLVAEDSPTVRRVVHDTLINNGYQKVTTFENGQLALDWINQRFKETRDASKVADALISDIEMPMMDGLHLCKRIKDHPELKKMPVLLFSSIVTEVNQKKGKAVGADGQISKPELHLVVEQIDQLILQARRGRGAVASELA